MRKAKRFAPAIAVLLLVPRAASACGGCTDAMLYTNFPGLWWLFFFMPVWFVVSLVILKRLVPHSSIRFGFLGHGIGYAALLVGLSFLTMGSLLLPLIVILALTGLSTRRFIKQLQDEDLPPSHDRPSCAAAYLRVSLYLMVSIFFAGILYARTDAHLLGLVNQQSPWGSSVLERLVQRGERVEPNLIAMVRAYNRNNRQSQRTAMNAFWVLQNMGSRAGAREALEFLQRKTAPDSTMKGYDDEIALRCALCLAHLPPEESIRHIPPLLTHWRGADSTPMNLDIHTALVLSASSLPDTPEKWDILDPATMQPVLENPPSAYIPNAMVQLASNLGPTVPIATPAAYETWWKTKTATSANVDGGSPEP